jgi:hypothetical protein
VRRVVLVGHSMGGLVIRHYIEDPARAEKVARVVTVGTPYWGSPKTIFPLAAGVEVPFASMMDAFMDNAALKAASRTFPGHFALMPAFGYGPWLSVGGRNGGKALDIDGVESFLRSLGIDANLYIRGASEHGRVLDHYADHDIPYEVIVGAGMPTIGSVALNYGIDTTATVSWVSGDETVPARSGASDTPSDRLHYVCGVSHVPLTTDPQTTKMMDDFVIRAEPMQDAQASCEWTGRELTTYTLPHLSAGASAAGPAGLRIVSGGRSMSVDEAVRAGLVQALELGGQTTLVTRGGQDVQVVVPAGMTATERSLSSRGAGARRAYGPFGGAATVALGSSGSVVSGGRAVKPRRLDRRAPVTRARVVRAGRRWRVALRVRDASRIAATYAVVGGKKRLYRKPLVLTTRALRGLRFGSVDVWGNAEAKRRVARR